MHRAPPLPVDDDLFDGTAWVWFDPFGGDDAGEFVRIGSTGVHMVRSRDLIEEVLRREDDFSANLTGVMMRGDHGGPEIFELPQTDSTRVIATADSPRHRIHRTLVQPSMTPRASDALEPLIRGWVAAELDAWLASGDPEIIDVVETIPARVVGELLGLPAGDVSHFRRWAMTGGTILGGNVSEAALVELTDSSMAMAVYLQEQFDRAEAAPAGAEGPMIPLLKGAAARGEITAEEALGIAIVMFGAGGESTAALIGTCLWALCSPDPDPRWPVWDEPERIPAFVDHIARIGAPFRFHYRAVRRPCALAGYDLVEGDRLMLMWSAANRADPDPATDGAPHLAFGRGQHKCVGEHLARLEARLVVEEFVARVGAATVVDTRRADSIFVNRLASLRLAAAPRS